MNTTDLEERVDALELGLALVEDDVADIETDLIIVEQEVDNLDVDVSIQEERILSIESDVVILENESASTSNLFFRMGGFCPRLLPLLPMASWKVRAFSLCMVFTSSRLSRAVPHGMKGTGPEFVTRPVYSRS